MRTKTLGMLLGTVLINTAWAEVPSNTATLTQSALPPRPYHYVLDESKALDSQTLNALQLLVVEHDRLTGQQVLIAIVDQTRGLDLKEWSRQVFLEWKIEKQTRGEGVLLAVSPKDHDAELQVGYGLESQLTPSKVKEIVTDSIIPQLQRDRPKAALSLGTYRILEEIQSPLIDSGRAADLLRHTGLKYLLDPNYEEYQARGWTFLLLLGVGIFISVIFEILAREAHFTATGWYRPTPGSSLLWSVRNLRWRRKDHDSDELRLGGSSGTW
jgi:uncharacterized membrane protein YgcG